MADVDGHWVTINGAHVFIKDGVIVKGPKSLVGKSESEARGNRKPSAKRTAQETPATKTKSELAKQNAKYVGKDIQRYSEERNEPILARKLRGISMPDSEAADVIVPADDDVAERWNAEAERYRAEKAAGLKPKPMDLSGETAHGVELKTMVDNGNSKITMKGDAMARKAAWMKEHNAPYHTVVFDDRDVYNANGPGLHDESRRKILYRRGYGSFRTAGMHPVKNYSELRSLMNTPDDELPDAAKPPASYKAPRQKTA